MNWFTLVFLYMFPTLCAVARQHRQWRSILVLNLTLGWTIILWCCALVWAFDREPRKS